MSNNFFCSYHLILNSSKGEAIKVILKRLNKETEIFGLYVSLREMPKLFTMALYGILTKNQGHHLCLARTQIHSTFQLISQAYQMLRLLRSRQTYQIIIQVKSTKKEVLCRLCGKRTSKNGVGRTLRFRHLPIFEHVSKT